MSGALDLCFSPLLSGCRWESGGSRQGPKGWLDVVFANEGSRPGLLSFLFQVTVPILQIQHVSGESLRLLWCVFLFVLCQMNDTKGYEELTSEPFLIW